MHLRSRFPVSPSPQNLKQAVAFRQIRDLTRNRIPRHVPGSSHCRESCADLVPVRAVRRFLGRANASQPGRIEQDDAFISDLQFDGPLGRDCLRQSDDGFRQTARVVDVGSVGLRNELQGLVAGFNRAPIERRRDLQHSDFLRTLRVISESEFAADSEAMLLWLDLNIQIVISEGECLAVERKTIHHRGTEHTEKTQALINGLHFGELHFASEEPFLARLCRTISNRTTAAATETFSDGTLPSIGIETRKSHFLFTRSCNPLPSPPRTSAQSML